MRPINEENGFLTIEEVNNYIRYRKSFSSNLIAWIEEKDGRFFACFNVFD